MRRAFLLLDPETKQPYAHWGLFAPTSAFRRLGQDALVYMRMLEECMALAVIGSLIYAWPMFLNKTTSRGQAMSVWGGTAIGAADHLSWHHVIADILVTILFSAFVHRQQRLTVRFEGAHSAHTPLATSPSPNECLRLCMKSKSSAFS